MNRRPRHYRVKTPWFNRKYIRKPRSTTLATSFQNETVGVELADEQRNLHDDQSSDDIGDVIADRIDPDDSQDTEPTIEDMEVTSTYLEEPCSKSNSDSSSQSGELPDEQSENITHERLQNEPTINGTSPDSEPPDSNHESAEFRDDIAVKDIMFMALNFYIRHKLTQEGLEDFMKMLNVLTKGKTFPESFATFINAFPAPYEVERVYFCTNCQYGYETAPQPEIVCPVENCGSTRTDFFIAFPIEQQIRETISKYSKQIAEYEAAIIDDDIRDINRGRLARSIMRNDVSKYITLSANEDSAAAVKCSNKKPIYPLFVTLNNLPPKLRFNKNNLILAALWFNPGKPNMALFHKNFVLQLQQLRNGITINNEVYKVVLLQSCTDSVGRCELFCSKQYNGWYGCTYCLHPGELVNNQIRYPYRKTKVREDKETRKIMYEIERCASKEPVFGIKGLCVLAGVPDFDIINGLPPDYMHMGLIGVTRILWELLMTGEGSNKERACYVGDQKPLVENRLSTIRLPSSFQRNIRNVDEYLKFKANEWETLLFHCIYPCMHDLMPKQYLDMIMLFSSSIYNLLQFQVTDDTLQNCEKSLIKFVKEFQKAFGTENVVYNIHLATHLVESVRNLGALWNSSLFPYENGNGMLIDFHTSNNHPVIQVASKLY
nr:uncharacterized protein LOC115264687 [Aedes albopictus]